MANVLNLDKQVQIIAALAEGSSIRSIERITGVHRDTIMRLGVRIGQGCATVLDEKMRNLSCEHVQVDEVWGFIGKKEMHLGDTDNPRLGDVWTFCAIDSDTKLVPAFKVGKRTSETTNLFIKDLANRLAARDSRDGCGYRARFLDSQGFGERSMKKTKIKNRVPIAQGTINLQDDSLLQIALVLLDEGLRPGSVLRTTREIRGSLFPPKPVAKRKVRSKRS